MTLEKEKIIGHYRIVSKIGEGGMGEVYLAEDTKLRRRVALKVLPESIAKDKERLRRFEQEAFAASALNHPNILTIYEFGADEEMHFLASEFVEGETLRERMAREPLNLRETLDAALQVAAALDAAHAAGIVHRDIKPENIMIRGDGYVKVLDFGLAKLSGRNDTERAGGEEATRKLVKTNPGVVIGTAAYMSPEQARGVAVDARSDVFSYGVMMYEILTGRAPFAGETMMDVILAVINEEPPPLPTLAPQLPKELIRIVNKTLKKKPDDRYHSTRDLLNDLKDLRDELRQNLILERTAASGKTQSGQAGAAKKLSTSSEGSSKMKDSLLLTDFENTTGEEIFDRALKTALTFALAQSPFLDIVPEAKVAGALRLMKRLPNERITRSMAEEICLRLNLKAYLAGGISNIGSIYFLTLEAVNAGTDESIGRESEQANSKEEVLSALSRAASGIREKLGESLSSIRRFDCPLEHSTSSFEALKFYSFAAEQTLSGKYLEAIPFLRKALEFDPEFAPVYLSLAAIYANTNQWNLAKENSVKAFELKDKVGEADKLRISYFYYNFVTGEMDKAVPTLELLRKTYVRFPSSYVNLADCYSRLGQFERAVVVCREAMNLQLTGAATLYGNLGESLLALGRCSEVRDTLREAFAGGFDADIFHLLLFQVGFIENDPVLTAEQLKWFTGRADEYLALNLQTGAAAFQGKWRGAQDFSRKAIDLASRAGARELAARFSAEQALRIVFWSSGTGLPKIGDTQLKIVLKTQINRALNLERGKEIMTRAALALACAGQTVEAESLIIEMREERPKDTFLNDLWLPLIRAAVLLQSDKTKEAIQELEIVERYEKAAEFYPQYLRGLAYLKLNKAKQAVREFDKILNCRGEAPLSPLYALAQSGKARATKKRAEYEKFFDLWPEADLDMPALIVARKEFENLRS